MRDIGTLKKGREPHSILLEWTSRSQKRGTNLGTGLPAHKTWGLDLPLTKTRGLDLPLTTRGLGFPLTKRGVKTSRSEGASRSQGADAQGTKTSCRVTGGL